MLTTVQLKALLQTHGLRLNKRLGQHYLVDERLVRRFIEQCGLSSQQTVIEIGAGLGALTEFLAQRAVRVIAVEVDRRISRLLAERMSHYPQVQVVHQDILKFHWEDFPHSIVIGAIPYALTSPILMRLCQARQIIPEAWLIVQKEIAQRLLAKPATRAYSRLSVMGQYCWRMKSVMAFPRQAFFPMPNVDSCGLHLIPQRSSPVSDERFFFELVKAAFSQRRKTLVNCLIGFHPRLSSRLVAEALIRQMGLPIDIRGEVLSLEAFSRLAEKLSITDSKAVVVSKNTLRYRA